MDNEKIKELSKSYAEWEMDVLPAGLRAMATEFDYNKYSTPAYQAFKWLSQDFCIIPKEEARKLAKLTFENGSSDDFGLIDGLTDWVLENFAEEYREEAEK